MSDSPKKSSPYTDLAKLICEMGKPDIEPGPEFMIQEMGRILDAKNRGEDPLPDTLQRTLKFLLEQESKKKKSLSDHNP